MLNRNNKTNNCFINYNKINYQSVDFLFFLTQTSTFCAYTIVERTDINRKGTDYIIII